jgi:glucuronoarabinoxylan endo-1,4-beta-xylanase
LRLSTPLFEGLLLLLLCAPHCRAQTATVYWNNVDQVIDGFGVSSNAPNATLTSAQATFFFSTGPGDLGLSLMRTLVPDGGNCATVNAACAGGPNSYDTPLAIANGVTVWSTVMSPPASMKTNGSVDCTAGSGNGALSPGSYSAYADYLANYVKSFRSLYGINLYAISVQNEPDDCQYYGSALWTAAQLDTFIKVNLGPTLASAGLSGTLIMMPESGNYSRLASLAGTTMDDPAAAADVGITAWHDYDDAPSATNPYASQNKLYWETEVSAGIHPGGYGFGPSLCGGRWDPSMADALMWAQIVDNRMAVANANAWHWFLTIGRNNENEGLVQVDSPTVVSKRAYMLGNYSKFVRPGFHRIDATHTPQSGVLVSAYKNASTGALVIAVINQNTSNVSQSFTLGGATMPTVTPWITSASLNLAEQSDVHVDGGAFTYTLPASSITSFVGNATTVGAIMAPTNLEAVTR